MLRRKKNQLKIFRSPLHPTTLAKDNIDLFLLKTCPVFVKCIILVIISELSIVPYPRKKFPEPRISPAKLFLHSPFIFSRQKKIFLKNNEAAKKTQVIKRTSVKFSSPHGQYHAFHPLIRHQ